MYDYKEGKKRVQEILNNRLSVEEEAIPADDKFTYENGYYGWVTAIFVDIRDSSKLFANADKVKVSKIIRSFTSEIIEILRDQSGLREIGIRGDCVYAIYSTPQKVDIFHIFQASYFINSFVNMLNKLLNDRYYPTINIGIGISTAQELVVKAGRKGTGISNAVWIGKAVTKASKLSSLGNKNGHGVIVLSDLTFSNIIDDCEKMNKSSRSWFSKKDSSEHGEYHHGNVIATNFEEWIKGGML